MLKSYFTTAIRNFFRHKTFSLINVLGLAIGISSALVIFLIVYYEFSFDKFEKDGDRIYRVVLNAKFGGNEGYSAAVPAPLGSAIQNEVTGVESTVPVFQFQGDATAEVSIVRPGFESPLVLKKQDEIVFTNPHYFSLLPYKWIAGSPSTSLKNPFNVVLTESRAKLYFPSLLSNQIIGKTITYNDDVTVTVSGIVKDLNKQTSFTAVEFISLATIAETQLQQQFMMNVWNDWMAYSQLYIKLAKNSTLIQVEKQLKTLLDKYNKDANKSAANTMSFRLQRLNDMHFDSRYQGFGQRTANKSVLYGLLAVAAFLLALGCINFINLTTANAAGRAKEIGIRKTMGSSRKQLVLQFLGETFLLTFIAAIISLLAAPLLLKFFSDFIPQGLNADFLYRPFIFLFLFLLVVLISFIAGLYPSLILSGYKPSAVLKNQALAGAGETRHAWFRKSLTVSQFVIAQFFIIATMMVSKQINFSINADLGYEKEGIINFNAPRSTTSDHTRQLLNEINALPEVEIAARGFFSPGDVGAAFTNVSFDPQPEIKPQVQIRWGDPEYMNVYKIKLLAGRNVLASDTMKEFLINNKYAKLLGFQKPEYAIGKVLSFNDKKMPIVGVMQDFHDQSMRGSITPLVFAGSSGDFFHIRFKRNSRTGTTWGNAITKIQEAYKRIYPEADFEYKFFDKTVEDFYIKERQTASLLKWATALTVFISCLGLLGLVIFTINTRKKEIAIRKVLGASVNNLIAILSTDFMKLVFLAFLIAVPIAWWAVYKWMQEFVYKTEMSWWVFAVSGFSLLFLALLTLSIRTIETAMANPVKSLRNE
jgi:putative ABC transport system permease protein